MSKMIICVGISNCGKSAWTEQFIKENPNTIELNRDYVRFNIINPKANDWADYSISENKENRVSCILMEKYKEAIEQGKDVIVSDTNLSYFGRIKWLNIANQNGQKVEFVIFHKKFIETFYGNSSNFMYLPDFVITNQYKRFTQFLDEIPVPGVKYTFI